ncbi:hypothetical protein GCM10009425_49160 [Pseudomonas asuensis]|uniref:Uncharacterized protein n=1 Tax=Pseudomonas asuensis TaxID=1825787 RepID=A0ABQ2H5C8_9PSED|nr:hypothetical protein GCM10009425_49160 [Pseudomonas asuensis]
MLRKDPVRYPLGAAALSKVPLHLDDIAKLQRSIDTSKTPLANVPAEHRWRLCLNPAFVDTIEKHIDGAEITRYCPL